MKAICSCLTITFLILLKNSENQGYFFPWFGSPKSKINLVYYDSNNGKNMDEMRDWFCSIQKKMFKSEADAFDRLKNEAKNAKKESKMNNVFLASSKDSKCAKNSLHLFKAECISVLMYTHRNFYGFYNQQLRNGSWKMFEVFTTLLFSAIKKLNDLRKIPAETVLCRGMKEAFANPTAKSLYFKQFTSTSKNMSRCLEFAGPNGTLLTFRITANVLAAAVKELSFYPGEEEILFSPFVALDFLSGTSSTMIFKTSAKQEFLNKKC